LLLLSPGVLLDWPAPWLHVWTWSLALGAAALVCALALAAWHRGGGPGGQAWMALAAGIFGLAVLLTDLDAYASAATVRLSVLHYFFYALLFVLWMMVSARMGTPAASDGEPAAEQAVRRRLAQDLHDGVGSQLVSIISGLSMGTPQQRATAASLQECVVELKLLVDGMSHEASVLAHLASLRYRMQPLMAAAGMRLHWEIADEDLLEQVQGDAARQVLRMAQEALANVVRHSDADEVLVSCRHDKQGDALVLEVADNGVGMAPALRTAPALDESAAAGGRGLVGMERRARRLGGRLRIEAAHGQGTRVRLLLPMAGLHAASMPWLPTQ
ncbi:MAG: ATP-binding protein, partial [Pseudomonadota bacterium]|nr:ATP-binding protein [Pseudomonadota bacterium]